MKFKALLIVAAATMVALFVSLLLLGDLALWQIGILGGLCAIFGMIVEKFLRNFM